MGSAEWAGRRRGRLAHERIISGNMGVRPVEMAHVHNSVHTSHISASPPVPSNRIDGTPMLLDANQCSIDVVARPVREWPAGSRAIRPLLGVVRSPGGAAGLDCGVL